MRLSLHVFDRGAIFVLNELGEVEYTYEKSNSIVINILIDLTKKVSINPSKIIKIETDSGTWKWNDTVYDFYLDYKLILKDKNDINSFCRIMATSKAKYIDSKTSYWIDIYLNKIDLEAEIKL